jgi:predicted DNA-binding protein
MSRSETTSIRLSPHLRQQLEQASHLLHRGKNWIITQALQEYISHVLDLKLAEEARRQSLQASQNEPDSTWEDEMDDSGWR